MDVKFVEGFQEKMFNQLENYLNLKQQVMLQLILTREEVTVLRDMIYQYSCCCSELIDEK